MGPLATSSRLGTQMGTSISSAHKQERKRIWACRRWDADGLSLGLHPEVLDQPVANPQQPLLILTRRRQNEERVGVPWIALWALRVITLPRTRIYKVQRSWGGRGKGGGKGGG